MTGLLCAVPYGPGAFAVLRDVLGELRGGDLLAPAEVAVPSSFTAVTVRRRLAAPGLVGVRFSALPKLIADRAARELVATGRRPLTPAERRAAVRSVLFAGPGGLPESARRSAGTVDVVGGVFAELDDAEVGDAVLTALTGAGGWPAQLATLYRAYLEATAGAARPAEVVDAACRAAVGIPLVVYLPGWLTVGELRFCRALAGRGLLRVVLGFTGDNDADACAVAIQEALAPDLPPPTATTAPAGEPRALPDAEEEVRYAVRRILAHLQANGSARPDRVGIAYRAAVPYARLAAEQLSASGLPHHAPRQRTLAQSVAGRTLLGLLALPGEGWSRAAVLDLLHDAPIRDGSTRLSASGWQRLACEAGVTRGLDQWPARLESLARRIEADAGEGREEQAAGRASRARSLAAFVTGTAARIHQATSAASWSDAASATGSALTHFLGGPRAAASWGIRPGAQPDPDVVARCDVERDAYEQVIVIVEGLSDIDAAGVPMTADALRDVLGQELSRQFTEANGVGHGVLVGPLRDFAGTDLDLLLVIGAAEGIYPPRGRQDPLLPDDIRVRAGLRTLAGRRQAERRDHLAAIAAAPAVVLTHPAADIRSQRGAEPAPWLLEQTSPRLRSHDQQQTGAPSFQAAVCDLSLPAATESEYDVRLIIAAAPAGPGHPLAAAVPELRRGLAAGQARAAGVFGQWTGGLSQPVPDRVTARLDRPLSATSLQTYAECPFRYFLSSVLGVHVTGEPDEERYDPRERGSAVHNVLERLVRAAIETGKPPGQPWTAEEHARAQAMLSVHAERMVADGKAGRPAVWAVHLAQWRRRLRQVLLADDAYRAAHAARPLAVEHGFGKDGRSPPLALELPGGQVELAGYVDRIDQTAAGELVVIDYKTGRSANYCAFPPEGADADADTDLTEQGRRLQLPLYALVARRDFAGAATPLRAYYWFVDEGIAPRGGSIDEAAEQRLRDVLDVIASGIRDGAFPARPGDYSAWSRSFANCQWCDFDRVCSQNRGKLWLRVQASPRARLYAALAEPAPGRP
ncbi:MAG: PD-(D/E)XK nuclease family protein [Streptosporangiaceae bacterium]